MFKMNFRRGAIAAVLIAFIYPQISLAKEFTSAEFLKWKPESQSFYFRTSIGMAGAVIAENNKRQSKCIEKWYTTNVLDAEDHLRDVMKRFPQFHPRGVILAVIEKKCGKIQLDK